MKSIHLLQPHFFPLQHSHSNNHTKQLPQIQYFSSNNEGTLRLNNRPLENRCFRSKAVHGGGVDHALVLTLLSSNEKSPEEITSFVIVSILLFGMYFVTNFVVPGLMTKSFETDKVNENQNDDDEDDES